MKQAFRLFYSTGVQVRFLIRLSANVRKAWIPGKILSMLIDNLLLALYGLEVTSSSIHVENLIVGHSTGVVLGGNGIRCTGTLHLSSGVVFARRYGAAEGPDPEVFFDIDGDLTIGSNSVLLGPLKIKGPVVIGALTLVSHDIAEPGTYVGTPAKRLVRN